MAETIGDPVTDQLLLRACRDRPGAPAPQLPWEGPTAVDRTAAGSIG
jgi:hypothetical protein